MASYRSFSSAPPSSNRLAQLIGCAEGLRKHGTAAEFTSKGNMVNSSFKNIQAEGLRKHGTATAEMIVELQARGIDMTSAIEQMQAERRKSKVIPFTKSQAG